MTQKQNPTTMIKGKFSNQVHALLEPNLNVKRSERWKYKKELSDEEKIERFDLIMDLHEQCSEELHAYRAKRASKKKVQRERAARGYVPKKKTSLAEWLKKQEAGEFVTEKV